MTRRIMQFNIVQDEKGYWLTIKVNRQTVALIEVSGPEEAMHKIRDFMETNKFEDLDEMGG